jgi:DNA repair exonuclease SbcCD ATPase subunit
MAVTKLCGARLRAALVLIGGGLVANATLAEPPKGGGDAAVLQTLRKAQGMLRELGQQKADLEAKNAELESKLKALEAKANQVEPLQSQLQQMKASLDTLQGSKTALEQQITGQTARLQTAAEQQQKTSGQLAKVQRDNLLLVNAVKERVQWIIGCADKNKSLVRTNREIIERLGGSKSLWDTFKEAEPLTGLGAIEKENAAQDFHYKLDDLEITPWQEPPPNAQSQADGQVPGKSPDNDGDEPG